jgi:orotidine-5'-phosphate decarboxylase
MMRTSQADKARDMILVALDIDQIEIAHRQVKRLADYVGGFKVGLELAHSCGNEIYRCLKEAGCRRLFIDLKFNDTPRTMEGAVKAIMQHRPFMFTVHATAGGEAMALAKRAASAYADRYGMPQPLVIAVTVLTSLSEEAMNDVGIGGTLQSEVLRLACLAQDAGLDGVVASGYEASMLSATCGPRFKIVTPNMCWPDKPTDHQARPMTPWDSVKSGADYVVIGQMINNAPDPVEAARNIVDKIGLALEPFCPHPD